jgi:hypothetical protein
MDVLLSYTFWIGACAAFLVGMCAGAKLVYAPRR